jgi:hypothetical protein
MSSSYEIPLSPQPQQLNISMNNVEYQLTVRWNTVSYSWTVDIASVAGAKILSGIPLVTGVDLLGQYAHLGLGFSLFATTDGDTSMPPTFNNLGILGRAYFTVA